MFYSLSQLSAVMSCARWRNSYTAKRQALAPIGALLWVCSGSAMAHVPYLAPAAAEPIRQRVSLEAAFADRFFVPEAKFDQSEFVVLTPQGTRQTPDELVMVTSRTILDHKLTDTGTYRFSTGERYGAVFHQYQHQGKPHSSRDANFVLPAGATLTAHFQSVTRAETYLSAGKPNRQALQPSGQGLEIAFISHPNELFAGQSLQLQVLLHGQPLANASAELILTTAPDAVDAATTSVGKSDHAGKVTLPVAQAGRYVVQVRHRAPAPASAKAPIYSYISTVVLDVVS